LKTLPSTRPAFDRVAVARALQEIGEREVKGFGPATEARLLKETQAWRERAGHLLLHRALPLADELVRHLRASPGIERAEAAGALRRRHETITQLDVVVAGPSGEQAMDALERFPRTERVVDRRSGGGSVRPTSGMPVRLEHAAPDAFGTALVRATGSEAHWRRLAELGEVDDVEAREEAELYGRLGLPLIPPELREDIRGMVHCHTRHSDGRDDVLAMARGAEALGMGYITITDHPPAASYAHGDAFAHAVRPA
jgi:DNA polymerase (family 10)